MSESPDPSGGPLEQTAGDPGAPPAAPGGACRRVLIVDDSASVRATLRETLALMPGVGEIIEAGDGLDALALLSRYAVDLVISDVTMPRLDGFKLLSAVRNTPRLRDLMVIMLSASGESVDKVRGLTIGANDYVTKPFERAELQARVAVMLRMKELQEELQRKADALERANRELERLAHEDALTGLPNRRCFFARLEVEFARSRRHEAPLGLLMLDIDHFKAFNDLHGHQTGDEALRAVGAALAGALRTYDCAARYGGEEFVAFLPETGVEDALLVAERIRGLIAALRLCVPTAGDASSAETGLTVSVGVASFPELPVADLDELVAAADRALYQAKEGGRNRCAACAAPAAPGALDSPPRAGV